MRALTDDELALFIRLLEADRREVDAIVAATDPKLIRKFDMMFQRFQAWEGVNG